MSSQKALGLRMAMAARGLPGEVSSRSSRSFELTASPPVAAPPADPPLESALAPLAPRDSPRRFFSPSISDEMRGERGLTSPRLRPPAAGRSSWREGSVGIDGCCCAYLFQGGGGG